MLKSYEEMRKIDVTKYCEVRTEGKEAIPYLNWAKCIDLLYQNGAQKVYFEPVVNPNTGSSLIMAGNEFKDKNDITNRAYETRIKVIIDEDIFEFQGPVMNGANPVKDNSMSQQRLWNAQTRLFVKAVAIRTGLGFDLWIKSEEKELEIQQTADIYHDIRKVAERVNETITSIQKKGLSLAQIAEKMNRTEAEIKGWINQYNILFAFEYNLEYIRRHLDDK